MTPLERYKDWLAKLPQEEEMRQELLEIEGKEEEIADRFYQDLDFGTAGLRGICAAGSNRMNRYTVSRAVQGITDYLLETGENPLRGAVIAYDCRYHSKEFSFLAARILLASGFRVYLFPDMRPTPELSFAIRKLRAVCGINMTASHNPKEYNGLKVYYQDGAQIFGEVAEGMAKEIKERDLFSPIREMDFKEAQEKRLLIFPTDAIDEEYLSYVKKQSVRDGEEIDPSVSVVYTPLNGAGSTFVKKVLCKRGFSSLHIVKEQEEPDPEFTTVGYPNPEDPKAFLLAEKLGRETGAELLIATDPDSDRMAVEIQEEDGSYRFLNGNQTGAMLIAYMAQGRKEKGLFPEKGAMVQSIVTGGMGSAIGQAYGLHVYYALTGFKNICSRIPQMEARGETFFFGYEESIGCAPAAEVRDKDGVCSAMLMAEMAAWCKKNGRHLRDYLEELYREYGYFAESQYSMILKGIPGKERISRIMQAFREQKQVAFGDFAVEKKTDYAEQVEDLPRSDVLRFDLTDGSWFALRPSGTEPKLKFYFYAKKDSRQESERTVHSLREQVLKLAENIA